MLSPDLSPSLFYVKGNENDAMGKRRHRELPETPTVAWFVVFVFPRLYNLYLTFFRANNKF